MKKLFEDIRPLFVFFLICISIFLVIFNGCGEDGPQGVDIVSGPIEVSTIILSPKSSEPGDTVQVTAVVISDSMNTGDFPTFDWSASGGVFLENNQVSVRWVAPLSSAIYMISVTATNSVSSSDLTSAVFVGTAVEEISNSAGEMHATSTGDSIYFLTPTSLLLDGFLINLFIVSGGGPPLPVTTSNQGLNYTFNKDLMYSAHTVQTTLPNAIEHPINIMVDDLATGDQTQITFDNRFIGDQRHLQHTRPVLSLDGSLVTYQLFRPHPLPGQPDTFDVAVYNQTSKLATNVTETHDSTQTGRRKFLNYFPSFSPDRNWFVFLSDRTGQLLWELYGVPIAPDGTVSKEQADVVRITSTGGTISSDLPPAKPLFTWNPSALYPVVALVDASEQLHVINPSGPSDEVVFIDYTPREMVWSNSGEALAISTGSRIYVLDYTLGQVGSVTQHVEAAPNDNISGIAWSRDDEFIVFRVSRAGNSWYELYDVGGSSGVTTSVIITTAVSEGLTDDYAAVMQTKPAWGADGTIFLLFFDGPSARITSIDLSGALP